MIRVEPVDLDNLYQALSSWPPETFLAGMRGAFWQSSVNLKESEKVRKVISKNGDKATEKHISEMLPEALERREARERKQKEREN